MGIMKKMLHLLKPVQWIDPRTKQQRMWDREFKKKWVQLKIKERGYLQKKENARIKCKKAAFNALPEELKGPAKEIGDPEWPLSIHTPAMYLERQQDAQFQ